MYVDQITTCTLFFSWKWRFGDITWNKSDVSAELMNKVCKGIRKEPSLRPFTKEKSYASNGAWLDISARDYAVIPYQQAFLNMRVFNLWRKRFKAYEKKRRRECIIRLRKFSSVGKGTIDTAILTLRKRCKQIYFPLIFISSNEMVTRVTVKKSTVCLLLSFKFFLLPFFFLRDPGITSSYVKTQDCSVFSTPTQTKYHSLFGTIFQ